MDQAVRMETFLRFQKAVDECQANIKDKDKAGAIFDSFLEYLMENYPPVSSGDLRTQMDCLREQTVGSFARGEVVIDPEWVPAFLVHKIFVAVRPGYIPVVKSKLFRKFIARFAPLTSTT
jgi:hypothetical protein